MRLKLPGSSLAGPSQCASNFISVILYSFSLKRTSNVISSRCHQTWLPLDGYGYFPISSSASTSIGLFLSCSNLLYDLEQFSFLLWVSVCLSVTRWCQRSPVPTYHTFDYPCMFPWWGRLLFRLSLCIWGDVSVSTLSRAGSVLQSKGRLSCGTPIQVQPPPPMPATSPTHPLSLLASRDASMGQKLDQVLLLEKNAFKKP